MTIKSKKKITRKAVAILNEARIENKIVNLTIADELDITPQMVGKYLRAERTMSIPTFIQFCVIIGIDPARTFQLLIKEITK
jgi:hypothetical protein